MMAGGAELWYDDALGGSGDAGDCGRDALVVSMPTASIIVSAIEGEIERGQRLGNSVRSSARSPARTSRGARPPDIASITQQQVSKYWKRLSRI